MLRILVPPIKCQGIKTKLVPFIAEIVQEVRSSSKTSVWIEPFMGSGVVGLNLRQQNAIFADLNPHVIRFYQAIQSGRITSQVTRQFLQHEGNLLEREGEKHYYDIRKRFNEQGNPLDFLFLSRACFNGMIRFNSKGGFNVPFCRKTARFARPYVTKIVNQVKQFQEAIGHYNWDFRHQDFEITISEANENDIIYCDPPYLGRHVDYFDSWTQEDENRLFLALSKTRARFLLSTWHSNMYRVNESLKTLWGHFPMVTIEHFYHVGAKELNRVPMLEAVVTNFETNIHRTRKNATKRQNLLFA
ncbi:MAG: DNA adenine methylase [Thermoguttaceae bacterium]